MLDGPYLHRHVDALLRLSRASQEPRIAAEIDAIAEEMRMLLIVAEVNDLAASINGDDRDRQTLRPVGAQTEIGRARS